MTAPRHGDVLVLGFSLRFEAFQLWTIGVSKLTRLLEGIGNRRHDGFLDQRALGQFPHP